MKPARKIAVLGATGSVGRSALEVIAAVDGLELYAISGHQNLDLLARQAEKHNPSYVVCSDADFAASQGFQLPQLPKTDVLYGVAGLQQLARDPAVDVVLAAIVGSAGLQSTWEAVAAGKTVALANKETLVTAGSLITDLAATSGAKLIPVDSEHSAIFQALLSGSLKQVDRVILTASGGPFRDFTKEQLTQVTVEQALAHPTWNMGNKITIDSATLMNKALEVIEAKWLFDLHPDQIEVTIHPQSIVHSMVEFCDGSVIAQLSPPDMKLPIQYALTYPLRLPGSAPRLDFMKPLQFDFEPPDIDRFPALGLGYEVIRRGGTTGAVVNAANEAAVAAFLSGEIPFTDITAACQDVMNHHNFDPSPDLATIEQLDRWARQEISQWILT